MYDKFTKSGYNIVSTFNFLDRFNEDYSIIIFYRRIYDKDNYSIGLGYDDNDGTWRQGVYDFKDYKNALKYVLEYIKKWSF